MRRALKASAIALLLMAAALFAAWATSPDPRFNPASFEDEPLEPGLAPLDEAVTLAVEDASGAVLLVTGVSGETVTAVEIGRGGDPFTALAAVPFEELRARAADPALQRTLAIADLAPAAPPGARHIGTGTNFPEHAEEASSDEVFQFPKFGRASPARTSVAAREGVLLDYEVELCMRFDRDIASLEDFDAAVKGLFLCGDFTDRAKLLRLIDPDNLDSGSGFSDGKSRADFYPSGPFLVIPRDWQGFVSSERMTTSVNGEPRQDARGGEMVLDFRALAEKALGDMDRERFLYDGGWHRLAPDARIAADMTLMSGTAEGVIFTQPTRGDLIHGGASYLLSGAWLGGEPPVPHIIETFLANETASGHFLQAGDTVEHYSSRLGTIRVEVR